jgi:dienelactone hydrolase
MKFLRTTVILLIVASLSAACSAQATPLPAAQVEAKALALVENLNRGEYSSARADFDSTMKLALPVDRLKDIWEGLLTQTGGFEEIAGTRSAESGKYRIIFVTCAFENGAIDVRVVFDPSGKVAGLFFQPAQAGASSAIPYDPPGYVQQNAFEEQEITVGSGEWALPGTLTLPDGPGSFPAVVLVHGSGPNDRDETIGPNKVFKDMAWGLASRGIAVLRYDKRTYTHAAKFDPELTARLTVQEETIDDALAALALLRGRTEIDPQRIYLLGHSLGATLAPRIAAQDGELAGIILLAGITRPLEDVTLEQVTYLAGLDGEVDQTEQKNIAALSTQVARVKAPELSPDLSAQDLPLNIPAAYWLDLREYNPAETAKTLSVAILVLQGERDYQVTMEDFAGWQQALSGRSNVTLKSYPALNHLFIPGEGQPNPQEYQNAGHVAEEVIGDIANWILKSLPS